MVSLTELLYRSLLQRVRLTNQSLVELKSWVGPRGMPRDGTPSLCPSLFGQERSFIIGLTVCEKQRRTPTLQGTVKTLVRFPAHGKCSENGSNTVITFSYKDPLL